MKVSLWIDIECGQDVDVFGLKESAAMCLEQLGNVRIFVKRIEVQGERR